MSEVVQANEFEFIVIGGGSAGGALAQRLASQRGGRVALVEAGPRSHDARTRVPLFYPRTFGSALDWHYSTEPQAALSGRRIEWPRGKLLGGSGAINALIYMQASTDDFLRWGWDWAADYVGFSFLPHMVPPSPHAWSEAFVAAGAEFGLRVEKPLASSQAHSCGLFAVAQNNGQRQHSGQNLESLEHLQIYSQASVERIELCAGRAVGARVRSAAGRFQLRATREIVLCAGTIGSPQILLQSGIGPADELRDLNIACEVDLPGVGHNLQDHLVFPVVYQTTHCVGLPRRSRPVDRLEYRQHGAGTLTSNIAEAGALLGAPSGLDNSTSQFQVHFTPTHYLKYPRLRSNDNHLSLAVTDLHPRSRGWLRLRRSSADVGFEVVIDPNYLHVPEDAERMQEAIELARALAAQPSLSALIDCESIPGPRRRNATAVNKAIQTFARSIYHPVGTCRMQSPTHPHGKDNVVDNEFRVLGVEGLRIADASLLPDLPSGNTNAVTLLIAARAADLLLARR